MRGAEYVPTDAQRALVESAAAFGLTQADIAEQLKIDEKTLRTSRSIALGRAREKREVGTAPFLGSPDRSQCDRRLLLG